MQNGTLEITILPASAANSAIAFLAISGEPYTDEEAEYLKSALKSDRWLYIIAKIDDEIIGGGYLNTTPKYRPYTALKIPEFQDLRVLTQWRKQGIGRALVEYAENIARTRGYTGIGISVGLTSDFGPAQRLYVSMGYTPDGLGITNDRESVQKGEKITIGDDLCLMLLKLF